MKKEILKQLIKEEIRKVIAEENNQEKGPTSGAGLAKNIKKTSQDLMKGSTGISSQEAKNVDRIIQKLTRISKDKNVSPMIFQKIERILDQV
jgi:hypothetical protein